MKGKIEIAAIADLRGLGEKEGQKIVYDWKPFRVRPPLWPWVLFSILFIIAFVKDRNSAPILVPVLILQGIILLFGMATGSGEYIDLFTALCLAIATILIQPVKIGSKRPYPHLLQAFGIILIYALLVLFSYGAVETQSQSNLFLKYGIISLIIILSVILSARICKKFNHGIQLLPVWILLCSVVFSGIVLLLNFIIKALNQGFSVFMILGIIGICFAAIFLGIGLYLFILPFIILIIKNSYYKSQLMKMLDLSEKKSPIPALFMPRDEKDKQSDECHM